MLEVLHTIHPSTLLMMDTWLEQWEVSSKKKKNISGGTCSRSTQHMTLSLTGTTLVVLAQEKLVFPLSTINQSELRKGYKLTMNLTGWLHGPCRLWRPQCSTIGDGIRNDPQVG